MSLIKLLNEKSFLAKSLSSLEIFEMCLWFKYKKENNKFQSQLKKEFKKVYKNL